MHLSYVCSSGSSLGDNITIMRPKQIIMVKFWYILFSWAPNIIADISNFTELNEEIVELMENSGTYQIPTNNGKYFSGKYSKEVKDYRTYDFIIVGGGTAGGVLANRLTEGNFSVLLVEAGPPEPDTSSILGLAGLHWRSVWSWGYNTTSQKHACLASDKHQCFYPRGRMLGGCSSLNGGMYSRGHPKDFEEWESRWSAYHPVGTARMGKSAKTSVVNSELKVHGIKGLRVVDASVIPNHISGHPNAPVVMIAELISDTIKKEYSKKN